MKIKYLLQQYEDGTFGYFFIDGDEHQNYVTESKVVCMQGKDEDRDEFIAKNGITFKPNQYGSNIKLDHDVNAQDDKVRESVAKQGYGLDKLINDNTEWVRTAVAEQGYGLEKLVNDSYANVRMAVARQDYGLDILVNDECYLVRKAVAKQGYGLEKLVNDEDYEIRVEVAKHGYGLEKLVNDTSDSVRIEVARQGYSLEKLVNDANNSVRIEVARQGYGLDILVNDEDYYVREEVAKHGYGLDILINDRRSDVCEEVANYLNTKADDDFIIDLGNKLLDRGYKLTTNELEKIFTDESYTKFTKFSYDQCKNQVLTRLLWKGIRCKEIYDPKYPEIVEIYLRQQGLLDED